MQGSFQLPYISIDPITSNLGDKFSKILKKTVENQKLDYFEGHNFMIEKLERIAFQIRSYH